MHLEKHKVALPHARLGRSFGPAKELVQSLARQIPTAINCRSAGLGQDFNEWQISTLIGQVQDALECYASETPTHE